MKGETGCRLSGWREAGATCLLFDPSMRRTCCACSPSSYDPHRSTLQTLPSQISTLATLPFPIADSPNTSYISKHLPHYRRGTQTTLRSLDSKQTTMITAVISQSNMKSINTQTSTQICPNIRRSS